MTQHPAPPVYVQQPPAPPPPQSNSLGLAGFITSLVSLVACGGIISPVGLILSLVALNRPPRGFAIAGLVLGIIGSIWVIILVFVIGVGAVLAAVGIGIAASVLKDMGQNAWDISQAVEQFYEQQGNVPAAIDNLSSLQPSQLTDPWGKQFHYEALPGGLEFRLVSDGEDGVPGNIDDATLWRRLGSDSGMKLTVGGQTIFQRGSQP